MDNGNGIVFKDRFQKCALYILFYNLHSQATKMLLLCQQHNCVLLSAHNCVVITQLCQFSAFT